MSSSWTPCLVRSNTPEGCPLSLGDELVDSDLRLVWARARPNTLLAVAFDLKVFFTVVAKQPAAVRAGDVFGFVEAQRRPRHGDNVVRLADHEQGLSARTIKRRLSSVSGLFDYLVALDAVAKNPVPRGLGPVTALTEISPVLLTEIPHPWASIRRGGVPLKAGGRKT